MSLRVLPSVAITLALAGCVTAAVNTMHFDEIARLRLAGVNVGFAPDVRLAWGDGARAYAASKGVPLTPANAPEAAAHLRNTFAAKLKAAMERHLAPKLVGSRPVRAEVAVKEVTIPSAVQRVVGGGHHIMVADVTLLDANTGAPVIAYAGQRTAALGGSGIAGTLLETAVLADPADRLVENYSKQYAFWLLRMNERSPQPGG